MLFYQNKEQLDAFNHALSIELRSDKVSCEAKSIMMFFYHLIHCVNRGIEQDFLTTVQHTDGDADFITIAAAALGYIVFSRDENFHFTIKAFTDRSIYFFSGMRDERQQTRFENLSPELKACIKTAVAQLHSNLCDKNKAYSRGALMGALHEKVDLPAEVAEHINGFFSSKNKSLLRLVSISKTAHQTAMIEEQSEQTRIQLTGSTR